MSNDADTLVNEATRAYKAGDTGKARALLMQATELNDRHEQAWLLLSRVVDSSEEQRICLENVLVINPNNAEAQQEVAALDTPTTESTDESPAEEEGEKDYVSAFESAIAGDAAEANGDAVAEAESVSFDFDDMDFDQAEEKPAAVAGPARTNVDASDLETEAVEKRQATPAQSPISRTRSPMEKTTQPRERQSTPATTGDYFDLIPAAVEATRLPGLDEKYPGWLIPGLVILVVLNLLALALLIVNVG